MIYEPLIVQNIPYRVYVGGCRRFQEHWHSEMELLICQAGSLLVRMERQTVCLKAGDAVLVPGFETHSVGQAEEGTRRIAIVFGYSLLGKDYHSVRDTYLHIPAEQNVSESLRKIVDGIREGVESHQEWKLRGGLFFLAAYLKETARQDICRTDDLQNRVRRLEGIYPVLEYVKENYRQRLTIDRAAILSGYDTTYFCKQFKSITGMPFHRYLNRYRISVACQLLEDPKLSVAVIAEMTGFSSSKSFCRSFKEHTGMTATQYQALRPDEKTVSWIA